MHSRVNWLLFISITFIWGSSFILMKKGMEALSPYQVASIRILSAGIILLPVGIRKFRRIPKHKLFPVLLSGLLGSFLPAYLFCIAEMEISSSLAGFLNALTPIFTIVTGILFFNNKFAKNRLPGVAIAFAGMCILFFSNGIPTIGNLGYSSFVLIATLFYALNVNMVSRHLSELGSANIVAVAFLMLLIPSAVVLAITGFFHMDFNAPDILTSIMYSSILGIFGTAVASILFYILMRRAGLLFSSMVTYAIPFVALFWGILAAENVNIIQIAGLAVILTGVYIVNR